MTTAQLRTGFPSCDVQTRDLSPLGCAVEIEFEQTRRSFAIQFPRPEKANSKVVFALHPYGGTPSITLPIYQDLWTAGYTLVAPTGVDKSWNAGPCCGKAKANGLDDLGFISFIHKYLKENEKELFHESVNPDGSVGGRYSDAKIDLDSVFVVGFSNGGFLTSRIALLASRCDSRFNWVGGAIAIAGQQYDPKLYDLTTVSGCSRPVPYLMIHGGSDLAVNPNGCCKSRDDLKTCCCGISESEFCTSNDLVFKWWTAINQCDYRAEEYDALVAKNTAKIASKGDTVCVDFSSMCNADTRWCTIPDYGHNVMRYAGVRTMMLEFFDKLSEKSSSAPPPAQDSSSDSSSSLLSGSVRGGSNSLFTLFLAVFAVGLMGAAIVAAFKRVRARLAMSGRVQPIYQPA